MEQFPSAEWRLLFALARWGGMRVPSEPESLRWEEIDFERMRINFRCPKTEHHDGKERREIPIFPELVEPLREEFEGAEAGEEFVLPFLRRITGAALRKPVLAALRAAKINPWPKLWNALRASRVTELRESFPAHVVDAWLGHDDKVARTHYAQILDEHFHRALQKCSHFASSTNAHDVASPTENTKNPAQYGNVLHGAAPRSAAKWAMRDSNKPLKTRQKRPITR